METAPASAHAHAQTFSARQRTIAMTVVALAFIMDLLDTTIVNIAIPSIQHNLGASYTTVQWLIAGYALAFALLLITGGRMGDVYGYKKLFMIGVTGFTLASLLSGLAWTPGVLIAARLLQGSMAALMVPQVMSLMQIMYPPEQRGSINGLFGGMAGIAASLGPIVGGLLIKWNVFGWDWRPIFLINVPVGIFAFLAAEKYLPEGKSPHPLKLDLVGTGIVIVAMSLIVYPLIQGRDLGWPAWTFISMIASLPVFFVFAWWQRRKQARDGSPLVLPALFHKSSFTLGLITNVVFEASMVGFFLIFTLMLQIGLGFSVVKAALTGIPTAIGISMTFALLANTVIPKLGRYALTLGTIVMATGAGLLALVVHHGGLHTSPWLIAPTLILVGVGMGLIMAPIFAVVLTDVDHTHAGSASGVLNAVQQLGGAIGVALIGVVFFNLLSHQAVTVAKAQTTSIQTQLTQAGLPAPAAAQISGQFVTCFHDRSTEKDTSVVPASCSSTSPDSLPKATSDKIGQVLTRAAQKANAQNFSRAFGWSVLYLASLLALTFALSFTLPRHINMEAAEF